MLVAAAGRISALTDGGCGTEQVTDPLADHRLVNITVPQSSRGWGDPTTPELPEPRRGSERGRPRSEAAEERGTGTAHPPVSSSVFGWDQGILARCRS